MNDQNQENRSDLSDHEREGSTLKPPFKQIEGLTPSSWKDDRLPEILWAALLTGNLPRSEALSIFRSVGDFIEGKEGLFDITLSGISSWKKEQRIEFIKLLIDSHPLADKILQTMTSFSSLPACEDWRCVLGGTDYDMDDQKMEYLTRAIRSNFWHQSQEATDCRWVKVLGLILSGKLKVPDSMRSKISNYPNKGDMRKVRPMIRATEIVPISEDEASTWPNAFWKKCLDSTFCIPQQEKAQKKDNIQISHRQINQIRHSLLLHFYLTDQSTATEARHDAIFGIGFYVLRFLDELVATNLSRGVIARLSLRSCVEAYITLAYLLSEENNNSDIWTEFRDHGIGQMKLAYLKSKESEYKSTFIDEDFLKRIANEDRWEEFSNAQFGGWSDSDLRTMSEVAGCKEIYDAYYDWTSTFSHASWGAIRESNFIICENPLHRLHSIPTVRLHPLPGVLEDVVNICNRLLSLIDSQYPGLNCEIVHENSTKSTSFLGRLYSRIRHWSSHKLLDLIT